MISLQRRCKKRHQNQVFSIRGAYFWKIIPEVLFYGASGRIFMLFGVLPDSYDIEGNDKYETNVAQAKPSSPSCSLSAQRGASADSGSKLWEHHDFFCYSISPASILLMTLAGLSAAMQFEGISFTTTLPAPMVTLSPMVTPGSMVTLPPNQQLLPMVTGLAHSCREFRSVGSVLWHAV